MPDLTSFEELVSVGNSRTVSLSSSSLAVLFSALSEIASRYNWRGSGDNGTLTSEEADRVDGYIDTATYELLKEARMREIGEPFALFVEEPPLGCLPMDGVARLVADYPNLQEKIPETWVSGLSFTLPDMSTRGLFGVGASGGFNVYRGETFGAVSHTLTETELPSHVHQQVAANGTTGLVVDNGYTGGSTLGGANPAGQPYTPLTTKAAGGGAAHNNMPPGIGVYWFIRAE